MGKILKQGDSYMTDITDRIVGKCKQCNKALLLGAEGLCICCENVALHDEIVKKSIELEGLRKKNHALLGEVVSLRKELDV